MVDTQLLTTKQAKLVFDAQALITKAEKEGRDLSADEQTQHATWVKDIEAIGRQIGDRKSDEDFYAAFAKMTGTGSAGPDGRPLVIGRVGRGQSVGEQFVSNPEMKAWLDAKGFRHDAWRSPTIEIEVKGILSEDPASGGGLVVPQYDTTIRPLPLPAPRVAELLARGTATSNVVNVMTETAYTNLAAATAEGAAKPESTITFAGTPEPVRKIAHWLPVTDEALEDVPQLKSYLDARLIAGVRVALDQEILTGSGVAPHLLGILNRPGLAAAVPQGSGMTAVDAIATQVAALATANEDLYPPDAIVVHPNDWAFMALMKAADESYIGGSPFDAPTPRSLWGLTVVTTSLMTQGQALVGAFRTAAQLYLRGGIVVSASQSHQDYWIKNLSAIRAETRAALAVYRPAAFGLVTGLTAVTPVSMRSGR